MKNKYIIAIAVLGIAISTSCKKVYQNVSTEAKEIQTFASENYTNSDSYIQANSWKIIEKEDGNNGTIRRYKLNVLGTPNFLIIDPVDPSKYWQTEKGTILSGTAVSILVKYAKDYGNK